MTEKEKAEINEMVEAAKNHGRARSAEFGCCESRL